MKKGLILTTALLSLTLGVSLVFAADQDNAAPSSMMPMMGQMMNWDQMKDYHKQMLEQAVKDGRVTAEQAKEMEERMQTMMKNRSSMMGQGMTNAGACCSTEAGTQDKGISQQ